LIWTDCELVGGRHSLLSSPWQITPAGVAFSYLLFGLIIAISNGRCVGGGRIIPDRRQCPRQGLVFYLSQALFNLLFSGQEISQALSTAFISTSAD
jgi:hypothetical protein